MPKTMDTFSVFWELDEECGTLDSEQRGAEFAPSVSDKNKNIVLSLLSQNIGISKKCNQAKS